MESQTPDEEAQPRPALAEKAVLARIMRGSTKFKPKRGAAEWSNSRDPQLAGDLVDQLIAVEGWQAEASVGTLLADWPRIVGPAVAAHCAVVGLEDGKLTVKADSSPWAAEIRLLIPQLQAAIDKHVGPELVVSIDVLGPAARPGRRGRFRV
ncbi:MAG: DciA family protein [Bifidobacteriaceae bacterium]|jgi:predicted nucleic acid-binding Zn ribbon protein|nr:DciA family protein [Bifidobacteriaceae bacterium]